MKKTIYGMILMIAMLVLMFNVQNLSGIMNASGMEWTGLSEPKCMAIGDYDNDGFNDLAFSEYRADQVTVYKSDGTTIIKRWTGLAGPYGVAIGDYDNDGSNDLAFTEVTGGRLTVYKNDGTTIIKQWTELNYPYGVAIGDYDNDCLNDLALTKGGPDQPYEVTVYKSDGTTIVEQWIPTGEPLAVAIGDYDNDGLNDLAFTEYRFASQVTVYKSDGITIIKQWAGISYPYGVAIGDYDNDGFNDLAFTEYDPITQITVYKSDGTTIIDRLTGFNRVEGVALGDYNNDGLNDLSFTEPLDGKITVRYGRAPEAVLAEINVDPDTLNLKSKGQWITSYIELPEGSNVADIDVSTVLMNNTVSAELQPTSIGDYDNDAIPDLMVKFNRTMVSNLILSKGIRHGNVTLTVTGRLYCGTLFTGSDVIRVKMPGDINFDGKVNLNDVILSAKAMCSHPGSPRWNPAADENEDNVINLIDFFIVCKNYGKTYT